MQDPQAMASTCGEVLGFETDFGATTWPRFGEPNFRHSGFSADYFCKCNDQGVQFSLSFTKSIRKERNPRSSRQGLGSCLKWRCLRQHQGWSPQRYFIRIANWLSSLHCGVNRIRHGKTGILLQRGFQSPQQLPCV